MSSEGEALVNVVDVEDKINQLINKRQEIKKQKGHCEELNSSIYLLQKYNKKDASIQREIKMIREAAQNTIYHLKDLLNENNEIVERYKREIIEYQQDIGLEKYGDCIKYVCQNNLDEIIHTIEKTRKAAEKVEFEDERHIELRKELVWQVDEAGALIKEKYGLINQLETKVQDLEEEKNRSEARCCKSMQDMDCIKVEMRSLVAKVDMADNHALGEMEKLASEIQMKKFKGILSSKEQKLQKLIVAI